MTSYVKNVAAALLVAASFPAWGGHNDKRYQEPGYDYAKVVDVQPVTEFVQIPQNQQVCHDTPVQRRVAEYRSPAPAIFGAIVGGLIGNQLSRGHGHRNRHGHGHRRRHGSHRAAATLAGAAIGGAIAGEIQYSKYPARYYTENTSVCSTETTWRSEERIIAWDVTWKYRGQIYHSRMNEPPGDRIRVRVSVDPVYP